MMIGRASRLRWRWPHANHRPPTSPPHHPPPLLPARNNHVDAIIGPRAIPAFRRPMPRDDDRRRNSIMGGDDGDDHCAVGPIRRTTPPRAGGGTARYDDHDYGATTSSSSSTSPFATLDVHGRRRHRRHRHHHHHRHHRRHDERRTSAAPSGGGGRRRDDHAHDPRRGSDSGYDHNAGGDNRNHPRRVRRHSTRLIGEIEARRTTDLFVDAHGRARHDDDSRRALLATRWDATDLLAAERALEFWAHRADYRIDGHDDDVDVDDDDERRENGNGRRRRRDGVIRRGGRRSGDRGGGISPSTTSEDDATTALRLFAALHHFHFLRRDHLGDGNDDDANARYDCVLLTNGMYSHVVDALARSTNVDHVRVADALIRQFVSMYLSRLDDGYNVAFGRTRGALEYAPPSSRGGRLRPSSSSSSSSSSSLSRFSRHHPSYPPSTATTPSFECPGILRWNDGDVHHFPNQIRITGVMRGYARHYRPRDAERLLDLMISLSSSSSSSSTSPVVDVVDRSKMMSLFRPNDVGYATVIDAYSRVHDGPNAERVLGMMKRRADDNDDDDIAADGERGINRANVVAYNAAISAWARSANKRRVGTNGGGGGIVAPTSQVEISSSRSAAESAERLLREMWSEHDLRGDGSALLPDVVTYSAVISAYAACLDQPYGISRARDLLAELEGLAAREVDGTTYQGGRHPHGFRPNALTYNSLLQAYANAGDASSAEGVLLSMISLHSSSLREEGGGGSFRYVRPNTRTFNVVLNALAKGEGGDGGVRASELLTRFLELGSNGDGPRPDVISYNTVLAAWSKSAGVSPKSPPSSREAVTRRRTRVVGEFAANEALKLLNEIEDRYLQSLGEKTHGHSLVVKPDVISYNTTIAAFANAAQHCEDGTPMARRAEEILNRMFELGVEPDAYSYNGVLLAWARSSGGLTAAKHAEGILRLMKEPTMVSWSTVVTAYAKANGAHRAETLLREMEENATGSIGHPTPLAPSIVLYNNVLHSWAMSSHDDASKNAELLLNRMEDTSSSPTPDAISYLLVLNALERTKDHDKAERARSILDRLLAHELRNSHYKPREIQHAYNSVLTACVYTPTEAGEHHRSNAARILVETLRDMNQFPWSSDDDGSPRGPNQETYAHFVQGCIHLYGPSSEERNELLKSAFHECCRKGLLNRVIWDKLRAAIGIESRTVRDITEEISSSIDGNAIRGGYDELPGEWSRNCPRR
ncbi:hypothetical protein ACHAXA_011552 [Cyclostephanos tholiformis]|uniref:Pentatricopeptide repeat-containing protein n=1 Tax=Cyclostephanos tholiformis TaxID=382380 RepID=A0ABD3R6U6_9STRA